MQPRPGALSRNAFALPFAALVLGAVAMGASPIFVRLADVGPFTSAFWRMALAVPVLWLWLQIEKSRTPVRALDPARDWKLIAGIGFLFAGDLFFWHLAIMKTTVANATLLATMTPLAVAFGAWMFLKEKVTKGILAGVASGVLGALLLVGASRTFNPENVYGDISGLITAGFFGAYFLAVAFARRRMSPAQVMFYPALVSTGFLFAAAVLLEDRLLPQSLEGVAALCALALISQVGGQGFTAYALGHLPAVFSSLVMFIEVLAAASMAWVILSEPVTIWQLGGGLLILAGIYAARPKQEKAHFTP
ncbi:EamA-like transporter family protein [bacterium BMS3Bbin10]|nr:EamA-like transporter family protein [bacterium BMS3Bbin10]HDL17234.1 DMT family transporter [Hyphomicrobiales bacterium]